MRHRGGHQLPWWDRVKYRHPGFSRRLDRPDQGRSLWMARLRFALFFVFVWVVGILALLIWPFWFIPELKTFRSW